MKGLLLRATIVVAAGTIAAGQTAEAGSITIDPVKLSVNGAVSNIGNIAANLNGNTMDATFTLDKAWADLTNWTEFCWVQAVTMLVDDPGNPKYKNAALKIPIIDTPNGGYDGSVGEDDSPCYLTPADIVKFKLNGTNDDGSKFFKTNDTPSVKGATFDTWLVAKTGDKKFCLIAGFEWGSGTKGGMATLKKKNDAGTTPGYPTMADVDTINTALTNGGFAGWTAMKDCDITCRVPEPAASTLAWVGGAMALTLRRRRAA
jgi:hypothetical protein